MGERLELDYVKDDSNFVVKYQGKFVACFNCRFKTNSISQWVEIPDGGLCIVCQNEEQAIYRIEKGMR